MRCTCIGMLVLWILGSYYAVTRRRSDRHISDFQGKKRSLKTPQSISSSPQLLRNAGDNPDLLASRFT